LGWWLERLAQVQLPIRRGGLKQHVSCFFQPFVSLLLLVSITATTTWDVPSSFDSCPWRWLLVTDFESVLAGEQTIIRTCINTSLIFRELITITENILHHPGSDLLLASIHYISFRKRIEPVPLFTSKKWRAQSMCHSVTTRVVARLGPHVNQIIPIDAL